MARESAQTLEVSVAPSNDKFIELTPAVDKTTAQQLAVAREGDNQTVVLQPAS